MQTAGHSTFSLRKHFGLFFSNSTTPFLLLDKNTDKIISANKQAAKFFETTISTLQKMKWQELCPDWNKSHELSELITLNRKKRTCRLYSHPLDSYDSVLLVEIHQVESYSYTDSKKNLQNQVVHKSHEFEAILKNTMIGLIYLYQDRKIMQVNQRFTELLGYTNEDLMNKSVRVIHIDDEHYINFGKKFYTRIKVKNVIIDWPFKHKDGRILLFRITGQAVNPKNLDEGILWLFEDITEEQKNIEKLRKSEQRLELAVWGADAAIWDWYFKSDKIYRNKTWYTMLGYEPDEFEISLQSWKDNIHPDDVDETFRKLQNHLDGKIPFFEAEYRFRKKDGSWLWLFDRGRSIDIDEDGNPIRLSGTQTDISERKEMELKLYKNEQKYRDLFNESPNVIYILDFNGKLLEVNQTTIDRYGYSREELDRMDIFKLSERLTKKLFDARIAEMYKKGTIIFENVHMSKGGERFVNQIRAKIIDYVGVQAMLIIANDITERREAETALERTRLQNQLVLDNVDVGIEYYDLKGNLVLLNHSAAKSRELYATHFRGKQATHTLQFKKRFKQAVQSKKSLKFEDFLDLADGKKWYITTLTKVKDSKQNVSGIISVRYDITERKKIENALAMNEHEYDLLFQEMTSAFALHKMIYDQKGNPVDYQFIRINKAFEEMIGLKRQDIIGKTVKQIFPGTENYWIKRYENVASTGKPTQFEDYFKELDKYFDVKAYSPIHNYFAVTFNDITNQRLAQKALDESEKKFKSFMNNLPGAAFIKDKDRRLVYCNPVYAEMVNTIPEKLIGTIDDTSLPSELQKQYTQENNKVLKTGQIIIIESSLPTADRVSHWLTIKFPLTIENEIKLVGAISLDITDRKEVEKALEEREKTISNLFKAAPIGMGHAIDRKFVLVNNAFAKLVGYSSNELVGESSKILYETEQDFLEISKLYDEAWDQGVATTQVRAVNKSGKIIDAMLSLTPFDRDNPEAGIIFMFMDISELVQTQRELQEAKDLFGAFMDNIPGPAFMKDDQYRLTYMNAYFLKYIGFENWLSAKPQNVYNNEFLESMIANEKFAFENGFVNCEEHIIHKNGDTRVYDAYKFRIDRPQKKSLIGALAIDITDQKKLKEQFYQSQKMEAIGHLAGGVAHDFNNLLTIINGYSDLILNDMPKENTVYEQLSEVYQAGKRAESLTRQLLAFSRKQILQPEILDANILLANLEKMLRRLIGEDIELFSKYNPKLHNIIADPGQLEQVIINLSVNARDAMPKGGKLYIETDNFFINQEMVEKYNYLTIGDKVCITIKDTGCGMDKVVLSHIFEPFYTTKELGKGTGLGLSTVYGIIKQSGGYIQIFSESGKGTTVKLYFNVVDEKITNSKKISEFYGKFKGSETILVVEDDVGVRNFTVTSLEKYGYKVLKAENGVEAFNQFKQHENEIDLLLTDVILHGLSGKEIADKLKEMNSTVVQLFMSGYPDNAISNHGLLNKDVNFIQKPFTALALLKKVRELLNRKD